MEFGASRSVVREAIKSVTMLGLLESRQGRGTLVTPLEEWNHFAPELLEARRELNVVDQFLLDLLEVRRMIEVEAAALAARRATERDLETMRQLAADMERASDDVESFARLDVAFHEAILAAAKNLPLLQLLRLIQPVLLTARIVSLRTGADRVKRSIREHGKVLQGIEGSDPDAARRAMATHLSWTARVSLGGGSSLVVGSTARSARKGRGTDGSQGNAANTER